MDIGAQLKELRQARGLTQLELGRRLGVSKAQVSQIETGYYVPSLNVLETILDELDARLVIELNEGGVPTDSSGLDSPPASETRRVSPSA